MDFSVYQHCRNKIGMNGVVVGKKIKNISSGCQVLSMLEFLATSLYYGQRSHVNDLQGSFTGLSKIFIIIL